MKHDTLDFVGDGDDSDLVDWTMATFGIKLEDHETADTRTVGQFYDLVRHKIGQSSAQACLTQKAFYRLRRTFAEMGFAGPITPKTPLDALVPKGRAIAKNWLEISQRSGLALPHLETRWPAPLLRWRERFRSNWIDRLLFGATAAAVAPLAIWAHSAFNWSFGWTFLGLTSLALGLSAVFGILLRGIPRRIVTVGDLAKEAAGQSFTALRTGPNHHSSHDVWQAIAAIIRNVCGHKGPITRDTTFFRTQSKS